VFTSLNTSAKLQKVIPLQSSPDLHDQSKASPFLSVGHTTSNGSTATPIPTPTNPEIVSLTVISTNNASVDSEKTAFASSYNSQNPASWSAAQVSEWLKSKNVSDAIIDTFRKEEITGDLLMLFTKEDVTSLSVGSVREKLQLASLLQGLKADSRMQDVSLYSSGSGSSSKVNSENAAAGRFVQPVLMEDGKGALPTYSPPVYVP
jgi:hypothetical protein